MASQSGYVSSSWSTTVTVTVLLSCTTPNLIVPSSSSTGKFNVQWTAGVAGSTYTLQESTDNGSTWTIQYTGTGTYTALSGKGSGSYKYRVMASQSGYVSSGWSATGTVTVTLP